MAVRFACQAVGHDPDAFIEAGRQLFIVFDGRVYDHAAPGLYISHKLMKALADGA